MSAETNSKVLDNISPVEAPTLGAPDSLRPGPLPEHARSSESSSSAIPEQPSLSDRNLTDGNAARSVAARDSEHEATFRTQNEQSSDVGAMAESEPVAHLRDQEADTAAAASVLAPRSEASCEEVTSGLHVAQLEDAQEMAMIRAGVLDPSEAATAHRLVPPQLHPPDPALEAAATDTQSEALSQQLKASAERERTAPPVSAPALESSSESESLPRLSAWGQAQTSREQASADAAGARETVSDAMRGAGSSAEQLRPSLGHTAASAEASSSGIGLSVGGSADSDAAAQAQTALERMRRGARDMQSSQSGASEAAESNDRLSRGTFGVHLPPPAAAEPALASTRDDVSPSEASEPSLGLSGISDRDLSSSIFANLDEAALQRATAARPQPAAPLRAPRHLRHNDSSVWGNYQQQPRQRDDAVTAQQGARNGASRDRFEHRNGRQRGANGDRAAVTAGRQREADEEDERLAGDAASDKPLSALELMTQMASAGKRGSGRSSWQSKGQRQEQQRHEPVEETRSITLRESMTVQELCDMLGVLPSTALEKFVELGETVETEQDLIPVEAAELVALDLGFEVDVEQTDMGEALPRPPVVTIIGHVDHGKTTLLDKLRDANEAAGEAGGITQHVGAFSVRMPGSSRSITFLDTPGHAAFSAMRARGTQVTDIAVLVVAADDGVMPQTREAIRHAQDAGCAIVVALTKCDRPGAAPERVEAELMQEGLELESVGGDVQVVHTAAPVGMGLRELEDALLLQADLQELQAPVECLAEGTVVEARVDRGVGPMVTAIVRRGTLRVGDALVTGKEHGRVRQLLTPDGEDVEESTPGQPVRIAGLKGLPHAGDTVRVVASEARARALSEAREKKALKKHQQRMAELAADVYDTVIDEVTGEEKSVLRPSVPLLISADVDGSLEALTEALMSLNTGHSVFKVIQAHVGAPSMHDVYVAETTGATLVAFGVTAPDNVLREAASKNVPMLQDTIIYKLLDQLSLKLVEAAPVVMEEVYAGRVEILATFKLSVKKSVNDSGVMQIAGSKVLEGRVRRDAVRAIVRRGDKQVWEGRLKDLRQGKQDTEQVGDGSECGIMFEGWDAFEVGDVVELREMQARQPKTQGTTLGGARIVE